MIYFKLWIVLGVFSWISEFPQFWFLIKDEDLEERTSLSIIFSAFCIACWPAVLFLWLKRMVHIFWPPAEEGAAGNAKK
jgi:hypothetical protein